MGMFDWVICQDPLPCKGHENTRFQTKSTPRNMWLLVIRGGRLYRMLDFDPEESHRNPHWGVALDGTTVPIQYDGVLHFYHYASNDGRVAFNAGFQKGRLITPIELMEDTIKDAGSISRDTIEQAAAEMKTHYTKVDLDELLGAMLDPVTAAEFEKHTLFAVNLDQVPLGALKKYVESTMDGVDVAIALHPEYGWAVITPSTADKKAKIVWRPGTELAKAAAEYLSARLKEPSMTAKIMATRKGEEEGLTHESDDRDRE